MSDICPSADAGGLNEPTQQKNVISAKAVARIGVAAGYSEARLMYGSF